MISKIVFIREVRVVSKNSVMLRKIAGAEKSVVRLHQATCEMSRLNVLQFDVGGERAEQRNSLSYQDRNAGDDEPLNRSGAQEPLNGDSAINVQVRKSSSTQFGNNFLWRTRHLLDEAALNS